MSERTFREMLTPPPPEPETILEHLQRLGVQVNFEKDTLHGTIMKVRAGELRKAQGGRL